MKGFLIIDQQKNAVVIPAEDIDYMLRHKGSDWYKKLLANVRNHDRKSDLFKSVSEYLKTGGFSNDTTAGADHITEA